MAVTSYTFPGTTASANRAGADVEWANTGNIAADDGSFATVSVGSNGNTDELRATNFSFSLPANATIDGIEVEVNGQAATGGNVYVDTHVMLIVGGDRVGLNRAKGDAWTTTERTATYGGSTDRWGVLGLTAAAIEASTFGVLIRWNRTGSGTVEGQIDFIRVRVHYTDDGGGPSYGADFASSVCLSSDLNASAAATMRFRFPGLGTPKAAIMFATRLTAPGQGDGSYVGFGIATGTSNQAFNGLRCRDNQSTIEGTCARRSLTSDALRIWHPDQTGDSFVADFAEFGTDYVELDIATPASGTLIVGCIALTGTSLAASVVGTEGLDGSTGATATLTPGFEATLLALFAGLETFTTVVHDGYGGMELGFAHNGESLTQRQLIQYFNALTGVTDGQPRALLSTDRIHQHHNPQEVEDYRWDVGNFTSTQFDVDASGDDGRADDGGNFLALGLSGDLQGACGTIAFPTSTGSKTFGDADLTPDIPFQPKFAIVGVSKAAAVDTLYNDHANAEVMGLVFLTDLGALSISWGGQKDANPSNHHTVLAIDGIDVDDGDGTALYDATFTEFTDGGWTWDFSAVDGTTRQGLYLAIGEEAAGGGEAVGTAAVTLGGVTASGSATFAAGTKTASAAVETGGVQASGSATFTAPVFEASAAVTVGVVEASGTATFATVTFEASAAVTLGGVEAAGTATFDAGTFTGTAAVELGGVTADGSGTFEAPVYEASAAVTVGGVEASGTAIFAAEIFAATAAVELGGVQSSGEAEFSLGTRTGTAAVVVGGVQASGTAEFTAPVYSGTASVTLGAVLAEAAAAFFAEVGVEPGWVLDPIETEWVLRPLETEWVLDSTDA